jgi:hypothetical protein
MLITSKILMWAVTVAHMGVTRNVYRQLFRKPARKVPWEIDVNRLESLKWILEKHGGRIRSV